MTVSRPHIAMQITLRILGLALALCASCMALAQPRFEAIVYDGPNLNGRSHTLRGEVANFEKIGFNDRTSSIRVVSGIGSSARTPTSRAGASRTPRANTATSARTIASRRRGRARPAARRAFRLFDGRDFAGTIPHDRRNTPNLEPAGFNDRARSFIVDHGQWRVCSDAHGKGHCEEFGPGRYGTLPHGLRGRISSVFLK
jgi:hypothetical protein